ncbi:hypothetical protein C4K27_6178 [Pseudomonas chlororaphis subsp. chlororaphis]|nr:hypothetical protein C4K27_6178 [Pseudomonas chlororaphis subsp. chlororaphis]
MMKNQRGWDDSQMYTVGAQFLAMPIMAWVDLTWARNANPYGGAENGSGFTSTSSVGQQPVVLPDQRQYRLLLLRPAGPRRIFVDVHREQASLLRRR